MLDEKTRAMLGDIDAQEAITARGELLPCPRCGNPGSFKTTASSERGVMRGFSFHIACRECGTKTKTYEVNLMLSEDGGFITSKDERVLAVAEWNTRAPILTAEQIAAAERMEG